jgi:hypothetical protein
MLNDPTKLTLVNFDEATAATHSVVALAAGETIIVHEVFLVAAGATDVTFKSATTTKIGPIAMKSGDIIQVGFNDKYPFLVCTKAEAFQITLSAAERVSGWIRYVQE